MIVPSANLRLSWGYDQVRETVNEQGQLSIDEPLVATQASRVRVIILFTEDSDEQNEDELDPAIVRFRQGWQDAMTGNTIPVTQLWDRLDAD